MSDQERIAKGIEDLAEAIDGFSRSVTHLDQHLVHAVDSLRERLGRLIRCPNRLFRPSEGATITLVAHTSRHALFGQQMSLCMLDRGHECACQPTAWRWVDVDENGVVHLTPPKSSLAGDPRG